MSVDRVGRRRFKRADVTTRAVGSGDSTLIGRGTGGSVSRIDRRAVGKKRNRRGGTTVIPKWAKLGVGAVQTVRRGKIATVIRADVVTGIRESAEAIAARQAVRHDRVYHDYDRACRNVKGTTLTGTVILFQGRTGRGLGVVHCAEPALGEIFSKRKVGDRHRSTACVNGPAVTWAAICRDIARKPAVTPQRCVRKQGAVQERNRVRRVNGAAVSVRAGARPSLGSGPASAGRRVSIEGGTHDCCAGQVIDRAAVSRFAPRPRKPTETYSRGTNRAVAPKQAIRDRELALVEDGAPIALRRYRCRFTIASALVKGENRGKQCD